MSPVTNEKYINTDVLVIGGGMAGLFAAIKAKQQGLDVILTDKAYVGKSGGTHYAEGEILFFRPERGHKLEEWMNFICKKGEYLNNQEWVKICLIESEERYNDLVSWGVPFNEKDGKLSVRNTDIYGRPNIYEIICMHYLEYAPVLRKKALESGVRVFDRMMFGDLLKQDGKVVGAIGFDTTSGDVYVFNAKATVIATGSSGLKSGSHVSHYWSGDGEAMAYRAGAEIANQEFSFGMLGLKPRSRVRLQDSTNKGAGISGKIIDSGYRFPVFWSGTFFHSPTLNAEGGPVISPSWEAHCGRAPVYTDFDSFTPEQIKEIRHYFQRMGTAVTDKIGVDVFKGGKMLYSGAKIRANSVPAGSGIWPIDNTCATGMPGLYAAGNTCATMGSGAAYSGMGFGLNHAAVTGTRAGLGAADYATKCKRLTIDKEGLANIKHIICAPIERKGGFSPGWLTQILYSVTIPYFFLQVKHEKRLQAALTIVEFLNSHLVPKLTAKDAHEWRMAQEAKNMALVAEMMLRASLFRTESRGAHYREDYPRRDDPTWLAWVKLRDEQGEMKVYKEPIPKQWWPDLSQPYEERYPVMLPGE